MSALLTATALDEALGDRAWRVQADPFYASVARTYGPEALADAGWFDDGASREGIARAACQDILCTPLHKLATPPAGRTPLVLVTTGGFSPPHLGHLRMLELARAVLSRRGEFVAGGYLAPDHDAYVEVKHGGTAALPAPHRVALCQAAAADSDWLMTCPWAALWAASSLNYTDILRRLETYLRRHWHPEVEVVYVCGADNALFARAFSEFGRIAVIGRDGHEDKMELVAEDLALDDALADGRILLVDEDEATTGLSSAAARRREERLIPAVEQRLGDWAGAWRDWERSDRTVKGLYVVRDDLDWATAPWRRLVARELLDHAIHEFRVGVLAALDAAFTNATAPDPAYRLDVRCVSVTEQAQMVSELMADGPVISLDPVIAGHRQLHSSREFAVADAQLKATASCARPGHGWLAEQVEDLPPWGTATLIDDDICTGLTMQTVAELLEDRGITVTRRCSLLAMAGAGDAFDVVDLRDFLLGARDSGLVVRLPGRDQLARVPYLAPWVSLVSRARIPPSQEQALGVELWRLNHRFFEQTGLRVSDASPVAQPLLTMHGAGHGHTLASFCAAQIENMTQLPFCA